MADRAPSLRFMLAGTTAVVAALAIVVCGGLVLLTSVLHRTTAEAAASVESVRLALDAEIDLLLAERAIDPVVQRELQEDLRRKLDEARRFVTTDSEARAHQNASARVDELVAARGAPTDVAEAQRAAYGALEELVAVNVAGARGALAVAESWDAVANAIGIAVGVLLVVIAGGVMFWLRRRAFAPLFALVETMQRFARGDRSVRALEQGPAELREMSRRFNDLCEALATQRRSQVAFLGGVAHDLKNPLSVMKMSTTLLPADAPLPPEPRLRQRLATIGRQVARLERMLDDFLDITRIESGQLALRIGEHDVRALVQRAAELFEDPGADHDLSVVVPAEPVRVRCDDLRIEQVITNLVSNAMKYSPKGTMVEVAVERAGDDVVVRVTDEGVGIAPEDRERMFEPFRRVGMSQESVPGVGLGLFVVKNIVEAHGGRIDVDGRPGGGSTFRVHLPAVAALDHAGSPAVH